MDEAIDHDGAPMISMSLEGDARVQAAVTRMVDEAGRRCARLA